MTGWAWHLADGPTLVADLGHARGLTATWNLAGAGTASFELDGEDPVAPLVRELISDLIVSYNGDRMWRGRVGSTTDDLDGTAHRFAVSAVDYRGVLDRRLTTVDTSLTLSPADRAWEALDTIQSRPAGALGITRGAVAPGATRALASEWGETISAIIDRWGGLSPGGFDWWIDGDLVFQTATNRGTVAPWGLVYGETVSGVSRTFDPATYANVVRHSGADGVTPATAEVAGLVGRPEGRWESQFGDTNLTTTTSVSAAAAGMLLRTQTLAPDYMFTVTPGTWDPNRAWVGDVVAVRIKSGRLDVSTSDRITQITVADNDGAIDVQIGTGSTLRRDLARILRTQAEQLSALARR